MKRIILLLLLAAVAWFGWGKYQDRARAQREAELAGQPVKKKALPAAKAEEPGVSFFACDTRSTCKQMTSCEEARYFIKTCPGFNAGVFGEEASCEKQWCKN
jgi:predicted negative regulator of RcsB-dependent stress response